MHAHDTVWESERAKIERAQSVQHKKAEGFQGCKSCDFSGFWLATYSPEGECHMCELEKYPERFFPCPCCRIPQRRQILCLKCSSGIYERYNLDGIYRGPSTPESRKLCHERLVKIVNLRYEIAKLTVPGEFVRYWDQETVFPRDVLPPGNDMPHAEKSDRRPRFTAKWPGFYYGHGVWRIPDTIPEGFGYNAIVIESSEPPIEGVIHDMQPK